MASAAGCHLKRGSPPALELAEIFRRYGDDFRRTHTLSAEQGRAMRAVERCRTAALGGHIDRCTQCGYQAPSYNSCRNRHCPKCQSLSQAKWIEQRMQSILPTHYFHVVFTLPAELHSLARANRKRIFNLLFEAAATTLLQLGKDPDWLGATVGFTAVLHTWTRELRFHPHLHCIVTGGGLASGQQRWIQVKSRRFLFPVRVVAKLFRGKLLNAVRRAYDRGELVLKGGCSSLRQRHAFQQLLDKLYRKKWVVYAKRPFGGAEQVYRYLGQYTHRIAISNHRLQAIDGDQVRFVTRNGRSVSVEAVEFIRRFLLHVLPRGFVKIRHYGLLASSNAGTRLERARQLLGVNPGTEDDEPAEVGWRDRMVKLTGIDVKRCPRCKVGTLIHLRLPAIPQTARPPPARETSRACT